MKRFLSILSALVILVTLTTSCEPELCEDCYTYTYSDGSQEWVCVEYTCEDY